MRKLTLLTLLLVGALVLAACPPPAPADPPAAEEAAGEAAEEAAPEPEASEAEAETDAEADSTETDDAASEEAAPEPEASETEADDEGEAATEGEGFTLTVLHTNDVHARLLQFNRFGGGCGEEDAAEGNCFGGVARRSTKIDEIRAAKENVILVDGGDQFQGTLFYNQYKGQAMLESMNTLGYDAMAVGNHEFDDGPTVLSEFISGADFPVLSANIDASADESLADSIQPYTVLDVNGEQIGVVGYTTEDTQILSSPGPDVVFNDIEESVNAAIAELEAMGINKIVAVSHSGFGRDQEVAAAVDGLDVIVSGHTNTFLSNTDEDASGPYPTVINSPNGDPVLVVSAEAWGKYLGELDVTFDADGVPAEWAGDNVLLDASIEENAEILARVMELNEPLKELTETILGETSEDLNGDRAVCRFAECNMGNLITDAILSATAGQGVQIAVQNGGGIRSSIPAGEVSLGHVLEVLPFGNTVSTFGLSGADVVAALENSVSRAENPDNEGTGRFLQVSGLRYTWDPGQEAGARIISVEMLNEDGTFTAIDEEATYMVAANNFIRNGGDGYEMFATNAIDAYDFGPTVAEVVERYMVDMSPVAPEVEGRIVQVAAE